MSETQNTQVAKRQRTLVGKVVSNKMDKTVVAVSYTHLTLPTILLV